MYSEPLAFPKMKFRLHNTRGTQPDRLVLYIGGCFLLLSVSLNQSIAYLACKPVQLIPFVTSELGPPRCLCPSTERSDHIESFAGFSS
jgi:hypothetical protein